MLATNLRSKWAQVEYKSNWRYDTLARLEKGENQMTKKTMHF